MMNFRLSRWSTKSKVSNLTLSLVCTGHYRHILCKLCLWDQQGLKYSIIRLRGYIFQSAFSVPPTVLPFCGFNHLIWGFLGPVIDQSWIFLLLWTNQWFFCGFLNYPWSGVGLDFRLFYGYQCRRSIQSTGAVLANDTEARRKKTQLGAPIRHSCANNGNERWILQSIIVILRKSRRRTEIPYRHSLTVRK